ncbi:MAG: patatin-like phospholipase family protein [Parcubacteria group bacterium]|nr:patatin-like phospholipase family protein [Parcubacteria group bacterium]
MQESGLVIMPGGMRNAFSAGVLNGAELAPKDVGVVVASSSGAGVGAFFVSGQIKLAERIFVEYLTRPEVYSPRRLFQGRRPYDVDYLVDYCCRDLDVEALATASTALYAGVFRRHDGQTLYQMVGRENWRSVLKATGALPLLGRPVLLDDGYYYVDGGIEEVLSLRFAYEMGYRRIILVCNRPFGSGGPAPGILVSFLAIPWWPAARRVLRGRNLHNIWSFITSPPSDLALYLISPPAPLPSERLTRSAKLVKETHDIGLAVGVEHRDRLRTFRGGTTNREA